MDSNKLLVQQLKNFINKMNKSELEILMNQFKDNLNGPINSNLQMF